jgi:hypothetical protein
MTLLKVNDTVRGRTPRGSNPLDADFNPGAARDPEEFQLNPWSPRRVWVAHNRKPCDFSAVVSNSTTSAEAVE